MIRFHTALALCALLSAPAVTAVAADPVTVLVEKDPNCGCCENWAQHLRDNGFKVATRAVHSVSAARAAAGFPVEVEACHTAHVGRYAIEGHVPAADIHRLLREAPDALGLAVPAMPAGSPGMESAQPVHYDTLLVRRDGSTTVFARH